MNLKELLESSSPSGRRSNKADPVLLRKAEARSTSCSDFRSPSITSTRSSADPGLEGPEEAKEGLVAKFGLSEIQAQAILDMRLQRLTGAGAREDPAGS